MGAKLEIPAHEAERLEAVRVLLPLRDRAHPPLDDLARLAADVCRAPTAIISLIEAERQVYLCALGTDADSVDRADSFCTLAILNDDVLAVSDASQDPRLRENRYVRGEGGIRSYVGAPVRGLDGHAVGTICIASAEPNAFGDEERYRLVLIADLVTQHLQQLQSELQAKEAVQRSQAAEQRVISYEHAFEAIGEGVMIVSSKGDIIAANSHARRLFESLPGGLIGRNVRGPPQNVIRPDGSMIQAHEFPVAQTFATGRPVRDMVYGLPLPDGSRRWLANSTTPVRSADGDIDFIVATSRDITDNYLRTKALERAQLALNAIAEGVHLYDAEGVIIDANQSSERILGLTREQTLGRAFVDPRWRVVDSKGVPISAEAFPISRCLATGKAIENAVLGVEKPEGGVTWISINAIPLRGPDNAILNVAITFRDISQQKRHEEQLLAALKEAQRAEHYAEALNAITEAVVIFDAEGYLVDCNDGFLELADQPRSDLIGMHYRNWQSRRYRVDESEFAPEESPLHQVFKTGLAVRDFVIGVDDPEGDRRWQSVSVIPIHDKAGGALERVVMIYRDITQERRSEELLTEALEEARKSSQAKSDFLGVMSHELRTPMNAVLGAVQMLSMTTLTPEQRKTLAMLEDSGRQMMTLLNDLFDVAALEGDRVRIEPEPVHIGHVIEEAAMICGRAAQAKGLEVFWTADEALNAPRLVDPTRLRQIIGNLLTNAVKFTDAGTIKIRASASAAHPNQVRIDVIDTGLGISPENLERVFMPFEQADASTRRRHGGMGIGLHVVRRLARKMGGDIALASSAGKGSTFSVTFNAPLAKAVDLAASKPAPQEDFKAFRLLCVDDNPRNLIVIAALLRAAGHSVRECGSGESALEAILEEPFDAVILDMVMPDMDGLDVLSALQSRAGPNQHTPVIACTANVMPGQLRSYLDAGVSDVVEKPIQASILLEAIHASVRSAEQGERSMRQA